MQENKFWQALEEYIDTHRTALDVDEPRPDLWSQIAEQIPEPRKVWWQHTQLWRVAAMIMIALGLSYWWYTRLGEGKTKTVMADIGHDMRPSFGHANSDTEWEKVQPALQARVDSLEQLPGMAAPAGMASLNHSIDSLQNAGPATADRVEAFEGLLKQKEAMLLEAQ